MANDPPVGDRELNDPADPSTSPGEAGHAVDEGDLCGVSCDLGGTPGGSQGAQTRRGRVGSQSGPTAGAGRGGISRGRSGRVTPS